ncbi:MAG: class I SAM-dependent methyltransferase [candidate division Zixibacteria bacterium]|nr:class I SAM-dependent methyltransferase [candidate division Zixibacteria bacterium]
MAEHVCPWWVGYLLASPLRRMIQNPDRILQPYVQAGMRVLDVGSAMGFFTLPLARLVGEQGRVVAVDLQEKMIRSLRRRAIKAGLEARIETRVCTSASLGVDDLNGSIDFALAFAVLHEMPDIRSALIGITRTLRPGAHLLIAEPAGHVSHDDFGRTLEIASACGLEPAGSPTIRRSHSTVLRKPIP